MYGIDDDANQRRYKQNWKQKKQWINSILYLFQMFKHMKECCGNNTVLSAVYIYIYIYILDICLLSYVGIVLRATWQDFSGRSKRERLLNFWFFPHNLFKNWNFLKSKVAKKKKNGKTSSIHLCNTKYSTMTIIKKEVWFFKIFGDKTIRSLQQCSHDSSFWDLIWN